MTSLNLRSDCGIVIYECPRKRSSLSKRAPPYGDFYFGLMGIGITSGAISRLSIISFILLRKPAFDSIDSDAAV